MSAPVGEAGREAVAQGLGRVVDGEHGRGEGHWQLQVPVVLAPGPTGGWWMRMAVMPWLVNLHVL
jgi:hypothetical protein